MAMCLALFDGRRIWLVVLSSVDERDYEFGAKEIGKRGRVLLVVLRSSDEREYEFSIEEIFSEGKKESGWSSLGVTMREIEFDSEKIFDKGKRDANGGEGS